MSDAALPVCRLAICDDVEAFRRLLAIVFELEHDIEVVGQASDGQEAIDLVSSTPVDVLLLDLAMPTMDGLEALPKLREASPGTKVIMLTGFGTTEIRDRALAAGADRYLEKGITPDTILAAIRDVRSS
jgi:DNA-binding NarL/FixJ family response regulator